MFRVHRSLLHKPRVDFQLRPVIAVNKVSTAHTGGRELESIHGRSRTRIRRYSCPNQSGFVWSRSAAAPLQKMNRNLELR